VGRSPGAEPGSGESRNGYRTRPWDTRTGTIDLQVPRLRSGTYFPEWLLTRRSRADTASITVVATSYVLGVSTRRVEKLVAAPGITARYARVHFAVISACASIDYSLPVPTSMPRLRGRI
jgi:transposase-like protein